MGKTVKNIICILCLMLVCIGMTPLDSVMAASNETVKVTHIYMAVEGEDKKDVSLYVAELESGIMAKAHFDVELENPTSGLTYKVFQYDGGTGKRYDIGSFTSPSFDVDTSLFKKDIPAYVGIFKGNTLLNTTLLTIRVTGGRMETFMPEEIASEYKDNLEVNMDELLPGMKFEMHPYLIPITAKAYTDGRVVIGMGLNSSNVSFWKNAYNGTLSQKTDVKEISDAFWGNSEKRSAVTGGNMGLVIDFSGWVQGNIYTNEPMKGQLSLYFGSGFFVTGQYAILTWDVTVTAGAGGVLDFEFLYNEEKSKYDEFGVDSFAIQFKAGLELYGGIGLSSIASVGVYGAGSITGKDQYYPDPVIQSIILAGECGFKVKAFSRTLFSFAIVSGSHEFVDDKLTAGRQNNALLNINKLDNINNYLLGVDGGYGKLTGAIDEPASSGTWFSGMTLTQSDGLQGFEPEPDFDHVIAEDIYPDNKLQVVDTSVANIPQMRVLFLSSDGSRTNGNRSRLASFYYSEDDNFISSPSWVIADSKDDGTADYNPHAYRAVNNPEGRVYLVWQNALDKLDGSSTFEDIAGNTDIYFSESIGGITWSDPERITYFNGEDQDEAVPDIAPDEEAEEGAEDTETAETEDAVDETEAADTEAGAAEAGTDTENETASGADTETAAGTESGAATDTDDGASTEPETDGTNGSEDETEGADNDASESDDAGVPEDEDDDTDNADTVVTEGSESGAADDTDSEGAGDDPEDEEADAAANMLSFVATVAETDEIGELKEETVSDPGPRVYAAGAKAAEFNDGSPAVVYYTNPVSDPIGIDTYASHDIYLAHREGKEWINEKAFSVTGSVTDLDTAYFNNRQTIAVSYNTGDSNKTYVMELWQQKNDTWEKVYERTSSGGKVVSTGRFSKAGNGSHVLTWFEDGALYIMWSGSFDVSRLTNDDINIPTNDYQIFGNFAKGKIVVVGTNSKDCSENAFAIQSSNGGTTWGKVGLTDIGTNALVSDICIAYTTKDEPIVFYSVQNYDIDSSLNMSYLDQDSEMLMSAPLQAKFEGLGTGLLLGQDDPRFHDTTTDLYIKARKANQGIAIVEANFDDETGAVKGKTTPATVKIENTGLYDIDTVTLFEGDNKLGDYSVDLKAGTTAEVKTKIMVPENAPDKELEFTIKATSIEGKIESEYDVTLGVGTIDVKFLHELRYGNEALSYQVTNNGFAKKHVFIYLFDEETGENFYQYGLYVAPHNTSKSQTSLPGGLWRQMGHSKVKAYLVSEEDSELAPRGTPLDKFEEILDLDSSRSIHLDGLSEMFLQDVSGAFKKVSSEPQNTDPAPTPAPAPSGNTSGGAKIEPVPANDNGKKDDKTQEHDTSKEQEPKADTTPQEETVPPETAPANDQNSGRGRWWKAYKNYILAGGGVLLGILSIFLFFFIKKRDDDEDEEENSQGPTEQK